MTSNGETSTDLNNEAYPRPTVRFDNTLYTDRDPPAPTPPNDDNNVDIAITDRPNRPVHRRHKSGILKRRENTITTADAPPVILSDEGLQADRVSPFTNFPLFLSMTIRSVGVIFGDM
jgi:hypothetical protein